MKNFVNTVELRKDQHYSFPRIWQQVNSGYNVQITVKHLKRYIVLHIVAVCVDVRTTVLNAIETKMIILFTS